MKKAAKKDETPWFVRAFNADYLARYKHRSDELARKELPFVLEALNLGPGASVLDLCCGAGRHSRGLVSAMKHGRVIGLDLSADLLRDAQSKNKALKKLCFVRADMRRIPLTSASMDGAVNLFTSFGYFKTDREHQNVLEQVARVLKPGGRFVIDFFNRDQVLATLVKRSESKADNREIVETRRYDTRSKRIVKTIQTTAIPSGVQEVFRESIRAYSPQELKKMLIAATLKPLSIHGDLSGAAFDKKTSPRCIWICEKKRSNFKVQGSRFKVQS